MIIYHFFFQLNEQKSIKIIIYLFFLISFNRLITEFLIIITLTFGISVIFKTMDKILMEHFIDNENKTV